MRYTLKTPYCDGTTHLVLELMARRLKRVFGVEIDTCRCCGGNLRIIPSIDQPGFIARTLAHLARTDGMGLHSTRRGAHCPMRLLLKRV